MFVLTRPLQCSISLMLYQEFHLCLFPSFIYLYFCLFVRYRCAVHNTSRYGIVKCLGGKGYILVFLVVVTPMDTPSPPTPSSPMMTTNRLLTTTLTSSVVATLRTPTSQSLGTSRSICKYPLIHISTLFFSGLKRVHSTQILTSTEHHI